MSAAVRMHPSERAMVEADATSGLELSAAIRVDGLTKSFGSVPVLRGISFDFARGRC